MRSRQEAARTALPWPWIRPRPSTNNAVELDAQDQLTSAAETLDMDLATTSSESSELASGDSMTAPKLVGGVKCLLQRAPLLKSMPNFLNIY